LQPESARATGLEPATSGVTVTEPESIKGVCETWAECRSRVDGVKGAKYQKVHDEAQAQALLEGTG